MDSPIPGTAMVAVDLLDRFASAEMQEVAAAEVRRPARVDGLLRDALFLHPKEGVRALATFPLDLPAIASDERLLLIFETALSDGIPWEQELRPDGVGFTVVVDGTKVFERTVRESLWIPGAVDLSERAGRRVSVTFVCDPGKTIRYDWALWGRPRIVRVRPRQGYLPRHGLLGFRLTQPADVMIGKPAGVAEKVRLEAGFHWISRAWGQPEAPAGFVEPATALDQKSVVGADWPAKLRITGMAFAAPVQRAGQPATLLVEVHNDSKGVSNEGVRLLLRRDKAPTAAATLPRIEPGDRARLRFPLGRLTAGRQDFVAEVEGGTLLRQRLHVHASAVRSVVRCRGFRIERGDDWAVVWRDGVRSWSAPPLAWLAPLARESRFIPVGGKPLVRIEVPNGGPLPRVWVTGNRSSEGLVPGVQWLSPGEPSSNPRGFGPDFHDRSSPPMDHLCAPFLAVAVGASSKPLTLNPAPDWCPDSAFGGLEGRPNPEGATTVALWWKPSAQARPQVEIPLRSTPTEASLLAVGGVHAATLCVIDGLTLGAMRAWMDDTGGLPRPLAPSRSDRESRALCRGAWDRMRDGKTGKWRIVVEGAAEPAPGVAALALWDALHTGLGIEEARVAAAAIRPEARADRNGAHIVRWELPFLIGGMHAAMAAVDREVAGLRSSQRDDGGWDFGAREGAVARLGRPGDRLSGTGSHAAWMVLRHARITGNAQSLAAGRRALAFLRRCHLPRGASVWECPIYEPDILAAGWLVAACNEGYAATGDRAFLDEAVVWAENAVPFIYLWNRPDRPAMRGASIATFGTTFFLHNWIGRPVQWEGLLLGWHLRDLARHLRIAGRRAHGALGFRPDDWLRLTDLMVASGLWQQRTDGEYAGTYPDSIADFREPQPVHINPENLAVHLFARAGEPLEIRTVSAEGGFVVNAVARITRVRAGNGHLEFTVGRLARGGSWVLVQGGDAPRAVTVDGQKSREWEWDAQTARLAVRIGPGTTPVLVAIDHR